MNGKGSGRRPSKVSKSEFDDNFDRIFGKPAPEKAKIGAGKERRTSISTTLVDRDGARITVKGGY